MRYDTNSGDAWERFRKTNGELSVNGKILEAVDIFGPLSCERLRVAINGKHQTVSAQISHLRDDGELIVVRRVFEDGRNVNLYDRPSGSPQLVML
jgi:hypothetical protein